jgi:putative SOS response-associated peptidase YedK
MARLLQLFFPQRNTPSEAHKINLYHICATKNVSHKCGKVRSARWEVIRPRWLKPLTRTPDASTICHNLLMCGRYRLSRRKQMIEEYFSTVSSEDDWSPRYNIAPTQPVPVIRQNPKEPRRELSLMKWGLIPSWAKDQSVGAQMINARSETAATKLAIRDPLTIRRCLIPADGFYEWQRRGKAKQPYCFEVNDGELFAFAGLWDRWRDTRGQWLKSCSILTTTPNAVTSSVHDRMPVILDPDSYDLWLDPGMRDVAAASEMLKPYDARLMCCYPVSTRINHVANDDEECSRPMEIAQIQDRLF